MRMLYKEIEEEAIMTTEEKCNTQIEQQHQQQRITRRNTNTVKSNTCRSNFQHLVSHWKNQTTEDFVFEAATKKLGRKQ